MVRTRTRMKWLALLFFIVLAQGSDDLRNSKEGPIKYKTDKYDDRKDISVLKVDLKLTVDEFKNGALTFPPPAVENGDFGGEEFKKDITRAAARWGYELNHVIYHEGLAAGHNLIEAIKEKYDKLAYSIDQSSKNGLENSYVNKDLQHLVKQLWTFLDLKPGNQKIEHVHLPELPKIPTKIVSQTMNRTASHIFLNISDFLDKDLSSIYGYMNGIFLRGWHNTRKYFDIQQMEYRNQILNGSVLRAYRYYVEKVFKRCDYIEKCVSKETWESFRAAGIQIIEISNKWQETLEKLENEEQSS